MDVDYDRNEDPELDRQLGLAQELTIQHIYGLDDTNDQADTTNAGNTPRNKTGSANPESRTLGVLPAKTPVMRNKPIILSQPRDPRQQARLTDPANPPESSALQLSHRKSGGSNPTNPPEGHPSTDNLTFVNPTAHLSQQTPGGSASSQYYQTDQYGPAFTQRTRQRLDWTDRGLHVSREQVQHFHVDPQSFAESLTAASRAVSPDMQYLEARNRDLEQSQMQLENHANQEHQSKMTEIQ